MSIETFSAWLPVAKDVVQLMGFALAIWYMVYSIRKASADPKNGFNIWDAARDPTSGMASNSQIILAGSFILSAWVMVSVVLAQRWDMVIALLSVILAAFVTNRVANAITSAWKEKGSTTAPADQEQKP